MRRLCRVLMACALRYNNTHEHNRNHKEATLKSVWFFRRFSVVDGFAPDSHGLLQAEVCVVRPRWVSENVLCSNAIVTCGPTACGSVDPFAS